MESSGPRATKASASYPDDNNENHTSNL